MTRRIVAASLKFRLLVLMAAAGLLIAGVATLSKAPVDTYPEFTAPSVEIQTEALGLSAGEIEQLITVPLEADLLAGVAWLKTMHSESIPGLSSINLIFEPGTNLLKARQMVQERLNQPAAIPNVSKPPTMLPPTSSTSRTMMIGLSSDKLSLIDIGVLARWTIRPRLLGVPGVANVAIWGGRDRQLQVQVDPQHLKDAGVTLDQVVSTAGNSLWVSSLSFLEASSPGTGGFFDAPNQRLAVRHVSPINTADQLANVPVEPTDEKPAPKGPGGAPLRLGDVGSVVEDHQPLIGDAIVNGKPGLMLVVEKLPTGNTLDVTKGVDEAINALRPGLPGLDIDTNVFRPAKFINHAVSDLGRTLVLGFALLVLALALLFYQWRTALIVVASVVTSVVTAAFVLHFRGETINTLVFAGLVVGLGVIIDEAIVGAEAVARRAVARGTGGVPLIGAAGAAKDSDRKAPDGEASLVTGVLDSLAQVRGGLLFATVIVLVPLLPVLFIDGLGSRFGRPLALSYAVAVGSALVVALTVAPALAFVLFSRAPLLRRESPVIRWLGGRYERVLSRATRSAKPALLAVVALAVAGAAIVPQLRQSPVPLFKETDFLVALDGPPGTSLPEMDRITEAMTNELRAIPGVRRVGGHVGRAITSDKVSSPNAAVLWVSLKARADYEETVAAVKKVTKGYPGIDTDVMTYSEERLNQAKESGDEPVDVRIYGQDLDTLRAQAQTVKAALGDVKGLTNLHADLPRVEPTVQIEVDLNKAKEVGVKPGDVRRAAATLLSGLQVGSLFQEQKVFDVVVWGTPNARQNLSTIRDLLIDTPNDGHVRLGDVAHVDVKPSPNVIERDAVSRIVDITAGIHGRSRDAVLSDVRSRLAKVEFPLEYHYELVGNYEHHQKVAQRILITGIVALIALFLLLQAIFGRWRLAALLLVSLALALVGSAVAVRIDGGTMELGSLVGFLTVFGIATRQGVILLRRFQSLERDDGVEFGPGLVVAGARERFGPTLLTAVAVGAFFAPFAVLGDLPGHEIVNPMGGVILGGLVTSTLVTLLLLPGLYLRFGEGQAEVEELDLRDLWEVREITIPEPQPVATNGDGELVSVQ
jgi:CzcA family heavy metal efflux pump